jgi:hypothetical protein
MAKKYSEDEKQQMVLWNQNIKRKCNLRDDKAQHPQFDKKTNLIFIHLPLLHGSLAKASDIRAMLQSFWISITLLQAVQLQVKEKKN